MVRLTQADYTGRQQAPIEIAQLCIIYENDIERLRDGRLCSGSCPFRRLKYRTAHLSLAPANIIFYFMYII